MPNLWNTCCHTTGNFEHAQNFVLLFRIPTSLIRAVKIADYCLGDTPHYTPQQFVTNKKMSHVSYSDHIGLLSLKLHLKMCPVSNQVIDLVIVLFFHMTYLKSWCLHYTKKMIYQVTMNNLVTNREKMNSSNMARFYFIPSPFNYG